MSREHESDTDRVWDMIKKVGVAMFVTHHGDKLDARPLQAYPDPDAGRIFFMTDSDHVLSDTNKDARVLLSFASKGGNDFVSLDGQATVTNDRAKIRELWTHWAEAYWDGPDDPDIRVIEVMPGHARYWDGPNMIVSVIGIAAAAVMGKEPDVGTSGEADL